MKKQSFSDMISTKAPVFKGSQVKVFIPEQHRDRLMQTAMKQFEEGGSQEKVKPIVFPDEESFTKFTDDLKAFIGKITDEMLPKCRVYVTNDAACNFRVKALTRDYLLLNSKYTIVLEEDQAARDDTKGLVVRIILNREDLALKLRSFFQELDFHGVALKTMDQLIAHMNEQAGIVVEQMLIDEFSTKFGARKDWFNFAEDTYGIYDEGKLILTHTRWKRSVSLKMPINGNRPWKYHFVMNEDKSRPSASFQVNAYGALWHQPKA